MTGFINTLVDLSLKGSFVIGIVLVLRLALKKAPKIFFLQPLGHCLCQFNTAIFYKKSTGLWKFPSKRPCYKKPS